MKAVFVFLCFQFWFYCSAIAQNEYSDIEYILAVPETEDAVYEENLKLLLKDKSINEEKYLIGATSLIIYSDVAEINPEYLKEILLEADQKVLKVTDLEVKARYLLKKGRLSYLSSKFEVARIALQKSIEFYEELGDSSINDFGQAYYELSTLNNSTGDLLGSLENSKKAISVFKNQNDTLSWLWASMIQEIMFSSNQIEAEARRVRQENRELAELINANGILANSYTTEYISLSKNGEYKEGIEKLKNALENASKISGYQGEIMSFMLNSLLVINYAKIGDRLTSTSYLRSAEKQYPKFKHLKRMENYLTVARAYHAYVSKNYTKAEQLILRILKSFEDNPEQEGKLLGLELMVDIKEKVGDLKGGFEYYKKLTDHKEAVFNRVSSNQLLYYNEAFKTLEREREIAEQKSLLQSLVIDHKNRIQSIVIASFIAILLITLLYLLHTSRLYRQRRIQQEEFSQDLLGTQEQERKRIAKELHDGLGQNLILMQGQQELKEVKLIAKESLESIRTITQNLHPFILERFGLVEALRQLIKRVDESSDVFVVEEIDLEYVELPEDVALNIYRMVQESISNSLKYSQTKTLKVGISKDAKALKVEIEDFGKGFKLEEARLKKNSLGIKTIEERGKAIGAEVDIQTKPGAGTKVIISLPND
ncbi:sensor histidine kinase [Jiulongibacter sp. NS-SX5]|uniref:sensor histidine kinase n=1 Tax=Jiulongibacter sp. NS-SX5 TaxID=3463854 RepID=UPI004058D1C4